MSSRWRGRTPSLRPGQAAFARTCIDHGIPAAYLVGSANGMVRMIGPDTSGDDWREHLVGHWAELNMPDVLKLLIKAN